MVQKCDENVAIGAETRIALGSIRSEVMTTFILRNQGLGGCIFSKKLKCE